MVDKNLEKKTIRKKHKHSVKHSKENALEDHEKIALLSEIKNLSMDAKIKYKYEVLIHLMMNAGMRVSEALQVRYEWFDEIEDGIIIRIPAKARDLFNMKKDWKPKNTASKREVIFVDKGIGEKVRSFFISNKSIGFSRQRAYQLIRMLGEKIGKPYLHPHALRSTYANSLVYMGVNVHTLCLFMGWKNLQTAVHYIQTSNVAARKDLLQRVKLTKD